MSLDSLDHGNQAVSHSTMLDHMDGAQEGTVTMAASDDHFRRPDGQEEFAAGVRVPCAAEHDRDRVWCAPARVRPGVAGFGDGLTRRAALDDLRAGLAALLSVTGPHS